jgi:hypothetical protein
VHANVHTCMAADADDCRFNPELVESSQRGPRLSGAARESAPPLSWWLRLSDHRERSVSMACEPLSSLT